MADISDRELRKQLDERFASMKTERKPWDADARDIARFGLRSQSRFITGMDTRNNGNTVVERKANNRLFNAKMPRSLSTLKNGMSSGLSSPSQPWFSLKPSDPDLAKVQSVKEWVDTVTAAMYAFMASTRLYSAMQSGYGEIATFGTEVGLITPHWSVGAACYAYTWGETWISQNDALEVDRMARDASMTVGQMYAKFGHDEKSVAKFSLSVREAYKNNRLSQMVPLYHMIEPNDERVYGKIDRTNKPYRSVYWEPDNTDENAGIISFGGFDRKPFWAARWETEGMEVYSAGPGSHALPDGRKLQMQELRLQQAMDFTVRPPLRMNIADRNQQANLVPGGITYSAATDMQNPAAPIWQVMPQAIPNISADISRTEYAIGETLFTPLFNMFEGINGSQPRTAEEIVRRHEDRLALLGPVIDRVQVEKLQPIILQVFSIMSNAGLLPPVPDELEGQPIDVEFVSILSQAQKLMGLSSMERALGFVGNVAGVKPEILDVPDFDDMVRVYFDRLGVPAKAINPEDQVAAVRQARAQEAQRQQALEAAPAMKDGAAAAELLSRTDVNGQSLLAGLLPQPGV